MANGSFSFKQFTIRQDLCAMKVGTDGTLLGAWAQGGSRVLDIGTGTGLIALMMAQRFPSAQISGIDIDEAACMQAQANVAASPFSGQVTILHADLQTFAKGTEANERFDAIVSNPPFFEESLVCPDNQRTLARHTVQLSYSMLMACVSQLLTDDGEFSVVIPSECQSRLESEAHLAGFFKSRECRVRTTPRKPVRRCLLAFRKHSVEALELTEGVIEVAPKERSPWYVELTKDFYL